VSRFFDASRIFAKSARAEEDNVGKARSPREAAQGESIAWPSKAPTNSHGSIVAGGTQRVVSVTGVPKWFDPGSNRGPSVC
jgi:hypothetical protein